MRILLAALVAVAGVGVGLYMDYKLVKSPPLYYILGFSTALIAVLAAKG